jgi:O-antigen/teichoic acid export membrane protein
MKFPKSDFNKYLKWFKHSLLGRTGIVLSGSVIGQSIAFLVLPLITQIYAVDTLGRVASTLAIFNITTLVICFQYDQAIIVAQDEDLPYLLILGFSIAIGIICIIVIILCTVLFISKDFFGLISSFGVNSYFILLLLSYTPFNLFVNFHLRQNNLSSVSLGRFIFYGVGGILQVMFGLFRDGSEFTFLMAQIITILIAVGFLTPYRSSFRWLRSNRSPKKIFQGMKEAAKRYSKFPKYQMEAQFVNAVSIQMPILFLKVAFSDTWAGWYFLAMRILTAPIAFLSQAIGQVFYRDSAERERRGEQQGKIIETLVSVLLRISLFPAITLGVSAPILIDTFMGKDWAPVATIIQIMLISSVAGFVTSPISTLPNVKNLQEGVFFYFNFILIVRVLALGLGWFSTSAIGAIWFYSVASAFIFCLFTRYVVQSFGGTLTRIFLLSKSTLIDSGVIILVALILLPSNQLYRPFGLALMSIMIFIFIWRETKRFFQFVKIGDI